MAKSILQTEKKCWFCESQVQLECHHIFAGPNRPISEKYGLKVWLCHEHHTGDHGAQYDKDKSLWLKQEAQKAFEQIHGHKLWMELIRKNYI